MNTKFASLSALLFVLISSVPGTHGQDSNVPESVRAMIQRSQAATQVEQTARIQVDLQFGDFLAALASDPQKHSQVEAALVAVMSERVELSARVANGLASTAELKAISEYSYLRARLAPLLNSAELSDLDSGRRGPSDAQLKKEYAEELERVAGDLTTANRELVLDTVIKYLRMADTDAGQLDQFSVDDLVARQSQSFMRAREELVSQIPTEQMQRVDAFLSQLQSNLYRNRNMSDTSQ